MLSKVSGKLSSLWIVIVAIGIFVIVSVSVFYLINSERYGVQFKVVNSSSDIAMQQDGAFKPEVLPFVFNPNQTNRWIFAKLSGDFSEETYIQIIWPFDKELSAYEYINGKWKRLEVYAGSNFPAWIVSQTSDSSKTLYFELGKSEFSVFNVAIFGKQEVVFAVNVQRDFPVFIVGTLLVMVVYNALIGAYLRESIYAYFSLFQLGVLSFTTTAYGIFDPEVYSPLGVLDCLAISAIFGAVSGVGFFRRFTGIENRVQRSILLLVSCVLFVVSASAYLPSISLYTDLMVISLAAVLTLSQFGVAYEAKGTYAYLVLVVGWFTFVSTGMLAFVSMLRLPHVNIFETHIQLLGILIQSLLFSAALIYRMRDRLSLGLYNKTFRRSGVFSQYVTVLLEQTSNSQVEVSGLLGAFKGMRVERSLRRIDDALKNLKIICSAINVLYDFSTKNERSSHFYLKSIFLESLFLLESNFRKKDLKCQVKGSDMLVYAPYNAVVVFVITLTKHISEIFQSGEVVFVFNNHRVEISTRFDADVDKEGYYTERFGKGLSDIFLDQYVDYLGWSIQLLRSNDGLQIEVTCSR